MYILHTFNLMKRFLPHILITVVILSAIFGPLGARLAFAAESESGLLDKIIGIGNITSSVFKKIVAWIGYLILILISKILALAGALLDFSIDYSINKFANASKAIVDTGWTICRDIANLFFIFVLLYIAIATILQLSGYGMKQLLARVIIIALLVNFSLMITGFIIDISNILALEFWNKINVTDKATGEKISPSEAITSAFEPQSIFDIESKGKGEEPPVFKGQDSDGEVTLVNIFIITIMGSIFFLVLAFVFLSAAIFFVLRTVVLWILMILAPLAFLAMALPATKQYASQWWKKLFDQSFFAPAYLFLLYLVISIVSSQALIKDLGTENKTLSSAFLSPTSNINLIFKFVTMIILSTAALVIAKQMGAAYASTVMGWGQKMKGAARGYAGKIIKRTTAKAAGGVAEGILGSEKAMAAIGKVPLAGALVTRGLAKTSGWKQKEEEKQKKEYEKQYGLYTETALQSMIDRGLVTGKKREVISSLLAKRKAEAQKKIDIEKEDMEYKKIERELPQMEKWLEDDENRIIDIDAELGGLLGDKSPAATQRRKRLVLERKQAEKRIEEVEQMKKRKAEIEEKRERRSLEQKVEEASRKAGEAAEKAGGKPPPAPKP